MRNIFIYLKVSCQLHGVVLRRPPQKKQPKQHDSVPHIPTRTSHSQHHPSPPVNISEPHHKQSSRLNQKLPYLFRIPLNRFGDVIYIVTPVALNGSLGESAEYATRFDDSKGMLESSLSQTGRYLQIYFRVIYIPGADSDYRNVRTCEPRTIYCQ